MSEGKLKEKFQDMLYTEGFGEEHYQESKIEIWQLLDEAKKEFPQTFILKNENRNLECYDTIEMKNWFKKWFGE